MDTVTFVLGIVVAFVVMLIIAVVVMMLRMKKIQVLSEDILEMERTMSREFEECYRTIEDKSKEGLSDTFTKIGGVQSVLLEIRRDVTEGFNECYRHVQETEKDLLEESKKYTDSRFDKKFSS